MAAAQTLRRPRNASGQAAQTIAGEWVQPDNVGSSDGSLGFRTEFPFHAIAPHWSGDVVSPVAVELQLSADGETFSDPVLVGPAHTDAGPPDRDGRTFGNLVFAEQSSYVKYRGIDESGRVTSIPGLSFAYINATGGPTLGDITPSPLAPSLDRPPVISREEWGAAMAYGGADRAASEWTPQYQRVEHIIIHHSETPSFRDPLAEIRSIHYYHAVTRGWGDIGYNYLVDFMGNVYEGRVGGENVVGGHAYQYAYGSAGICSMGSFSLESSTPEAIAGLTWISAWAGRSLDALGQSDFHERPNLPTICGHRDVNDSTCPGDGLYADLPAIRRAVAEVIANGGALLGDPEFSPGQIVATTVEGANVRETPGIDETIATALAFGTVLQIIDGPTSVDGNIWYQVAGDAGWGWIASSLIEPSDAAPPVGKYAAGDALIVNTDAVNIRAEPSLRALIVAAVPSGEDASVVEGPMPAGGYRWYRIKTSYGEGWAAEQYLISPDELEPESRFLVGDSVIVGDPEGLNLRSEPSTGTGVIRSLPTGTPGVVVEGPRLGDRVTWLRIRTSLATGWCVEQYLDESPGPVQFASSFAVGDVVKVDTDSLNLRERPGIDAPVLASLGTGVVATVIDGPTLASNLNWLRLDTQYGRGWCVDTFLVGSDAAPARRSPEVGDVVYVDTDGVNLRDAAAIDAKVNVILLSQETGTVRDGPRNADGYAWFLVEAARGSGWAASRYLGVGNPDPLNSTNVSVGDMVGLSTDGINVRATTSLSSKVIKILLAGDVVEVLEGPRQAEGYTWFRLATDLGAGWAVDQYLTVESAATLAVGDTARVIDGELNLRAAPGGGAEVIAVLADGAFVEIIDGREEADGRRWVRVQSSRFGAGWSAEEFLVRA
jgi:uncharacterized protein YgiM (DUF1202 family)